MRNQNARKHTVNHNIFKIIDTEEKAYWLGFLMADGCVYKGSSKLSFRLQINLSEKDVGHLHKFNNFIQSDYSIVHKTIKENVNIVQLKINSTELCNDLMKLGVVPRKTNLCNIPSSLKKKFIPHFIRGYFDGDGCITTSNNKWKITFVGNSTMLESIQTYLETKSIYSSMYKCGRSLIAKSLEITAKKMILKIMKLMYNNATIFLERKYNKFIDFSNNCNSICPAV